MLFSVDTELCNRDGICVEACGRRIIEMKDPDKTPAPIDGAEDLCNNCGHCVAVCPKGALSREDMRPEECLKRIVSLPCLIWNWARLLSVWEPHGPVT